ncbi:uncharacterized protein LOC127011842 [Drosophila biarmipes]|uniref:uncharacterized protein LOC127011842 n=1 Tax=Drosophila biarmipes TaxID=125945 RepID=UPI0021CC8B5A|nr:uncharacterized protein LOC127011842 [Drosophila biarmipes]
MIRSVEISSHKIKKREMRWTGQGCSKRSNCDIYYSWHAERCEFGCGFVVSRRLRHHDSNFTPVSERLATIRVKARFFNLSIIYAHTTMEEKDAFYARLEYSYDRCPDHDVKLILGDFDAKIGRERIFDPTVGRFSLHETTSNNGQRCDRRKACLKREGRAYVSWNQH